MLTFIKKNQFIILGLLTLVSVVSLLLFIIFKKENLEDIPNLKELIEDKTTIIDTTQQFNSENKKTEETEEIETEEIETEEIETEEIEIEKKIEPEILLNKDIHEKNKETKNYENEFEKIFSRKTEREDLSQQIYVNIYDVNFGGILPTTLGCN